MRQGCFIAVRVKREESATIQINRCHRSGIGSRNDCCLAVRPADRETSSISAELCCERKDRSTKIGLKKFYALFGDAHGHSTKDKSNGLGECGLPASAR